MKTRTPLVLFTAASLVLLVGASDFGGDGNAPEDPAAARKEIIRAFEVWGGIGTVEEVEAHLNLIDDSRGILEAARQAVQNFPYEVSHDVYRVTEVQFVSPTEAVVTYDIVVDRGPSFPGRIGRAVLKGGTWRLARATACADLALAGGVCVPVSNGAPDDPEAARQAIIDTWEAAAALTDAADVAANLHLIDDPRGVVEAARQAYENFPYEVTHDTNRVTDVRFTSPTDAVVTWDILIEGGLNFFGRTGDAVFKDGRWRMSRATACESLALAGGDCEAASQEGEFTVIVPAVFPTQSVTAQSVTPCPPAENPGGSPPVRYFASVSDAPAVELSLEGGPWNTPVDFRSIGKETFEVRAQCLLQQGDVISTTLMYTPVTTSVALGPLIPRPPAPPAPPAPSVPASPRFTG